MTCTSCGQANPNHLVFCQTCGQRLAPRIAPPTPPVGLPMPNYEAAAAPAWPPPPANLEAVPSPKPACPACGSANQPNMRFCLTCGQRLSPSLAPPPAVAAPAAPQARQDQDRSGGGTPYSQLVTAAMPEVPPMRARTPSVPPPALPKRPSIPAAMEAPVRPSAPPPGPPKTAQAPSPNRFHTVLGNPEPPPRPPEPGPGAANGAPVATVPVPINAAAHSEAARDTREPLTARVCGRCRGASDNQAQFCRFCGAPMGEAFVPAMEPSAPAAAAAAPSPAAVPAPPLAPMAPIVVGVVGAVGATHQPVPVEAPRAKERTAFGRLIVVAKDGGEGPNYPLHDRVDIGRIEGEVRFPDDRYLSPRHLRLVVRDGRVFLRDLETPNGVYLRLREAPVTIAHQGLFLIGQQMLRLELLQPDGFGPAMEGDTLLFGTPTSPRYARLCQRTVEGVTLDVFHIRKAETVLGRESGDIVFADDPFLSRRHATLHYDLEKKTVQLRDLGSSNGTFYRAAGDEIEVAHGDQFRIGQQLFRIELSDGARKG